MTQNQFNEPMINLDGKSILITGGTGSFGRNFCKVILERYKPRRVVIFSRDEFKQYSMAKELSGDDHECLRYFIGDVRDADRLRMAMRGIDYVIHAAAIKHVEIAEYNPMECVKTNVNGAENVVFAAMEEGIDRVIALSTDKAVNPINLYGASKLASDKIFVAANNLSGELGPRFSVVRYGNVVGSRGSVIPFFRELIANGATELPITDPEMTRFWITLEQGINFVLSSMEMMTGGEIFIPKIPSMRIEDMAEAIAPGMPTKVIGIRAGEKLHEIMVPTDESRTTWELPDRFAILPAFKHLWSKDPSILENGSKVTLGFSYSSDTNDTWLDAAGLNEMCVKSNV
jgi:UDP-N-acetylglucosamine 4,6-dehydratase